jgi:hypothetical protein
VTNTDRKREGFLLDTPRDFGIPEVWRIKWGDILHTWFELQIVLYSRVFRAPPPRSSAHLRSNGFYPYIIYALFEIHSAGSFFP